MVVISVSRSSKANEFKSMNKGALAVAEWDVRSVTAFVVRVSNFVVDADIHDSNLDGTKEPLKL